MDHILAIPYLALILIAYSGIDATLASKSTKAYVVNKVWLAI